MCGTTPCDRSKPSRRPAPSRPADSPSRTSAGRVRVTRYTRRDPFAKDRELRERQRARERALNEEDDVIEVSNLDDEEAIAVGHVVESKPIREPESGRL